MTPLKPGSLLKINDSRGFPSITLFSIGHRINWDSPRERIKGPIIVLLVEAISSVEFEYGPEEVYKVLYLDKTYYLMARLLSVEVLKNSND